MVEILVKHNITSALTSVLANAKNRRKAQALAFMIMNKSTMINIKYLILFCFLNLNIKCSSQNIDKSNMTTMPTSSKYDGLNGDDLVHTVFQSIAEEIWIDKKVDYDYFTKLPIPKKVIYKTYLLEMEVNNGGFNQFYHNRGIAIADDIPFYLVIIGAIKYSKIVSKANELYKNEYESISREMNGTLEGFSKSYENNPLNELDKEFSQNLTNENILELQAKYITENIEVFK